MDRSSAFPAAAAIVLAAAMLGSSASGEPAASALADLASHPGPERTAKLIEGAKKEGVVSLYSSATVEDLGVLTTAFEKKYGVKVRVWRGSSENILQRTVTEARGGRFDADVVETGALAMEAMQREQLFLEVKSDAAAQLLPQAIFPHHEWVGTRFNLFVAAYNTRLGMAGDLPKHYDDLKDGRWKGKLSVEIEDSDWFGGIVDALGEKDGLQLFRDIVAVNGISVRKGHTLLANLVASGEVPLALDAYAYKVDQLRKAGAPVAWVAIPPASVTFLDPAKALDENQKWSRYYRDMITNQAH
jgi:iron(III) transport system substrate-binding protein